MSDSTDTTNQGNTFDPSKFKRETVVAEMLKMDTDRPYYLKFVSEMYKGKEMPPPRGMAKMEPADLIDCVNLENKRECFIIVNTVLKNILTDELEGPYLDGTFEIIMQYDEDKGYKTFSVTRLVAE